MPLSTPRQPGPASLVEGTVPPGAAPAAHVHNTADEAFYLLSGQLEMLDGWGPERYTPEILELSERLGDEVLPEID